MKTNSSPIRLLLGGLLIAAGLLATPVSAAPIGKAYKFTTSAANTSGSRTTLDHPALNGKSKLALFLSRRWTSVYHPVPISLRYNASTSQWQVEAQDGSAIPNGLNFDVMVAPGAKRMISSGLNSEHNRSYFTVAQTKPTALLQVSHMRNPSPTRTGVPMTKAFGLWFDDDKWTVYTEDSSPMPAVAFNMVDATKFAVGTTPVTFLHTATAGNMPEAHLTEISHPLANGNPNASIFVTHYFGAAGPFLDDQVGVWYDGAFWNIYIEDLSAMPLNSKFVVTVIPTPTP